MLKLMTNSRLDWPARLATLTLAGALCLPAIPRAAAADASQEPFPDFGFLPSPDDYTGPVFRLSQDYPKVEPGPAEIPAFFSKLPDKFTPDFATWRPYLQGVRDYCFEGNLDIDWRVQQNPVRHWYHVPWQHYGPSGREGVHGLTKEAPVQPNQLAIGQGVPAANDFYQTVAVGFFNSFGGYALGQVWADHQHPNAGATTAPNGFPNGTVISKLLFVDVPPAQVPSLVNPLQWQAYIQKTYNNATHAMRTVSLIQMDFAVRDDRAPLGWIFGTFQYNGALNNPLAWNNLIPVGVMWGNDPENTNNDYTNPDPTNTLINPTIVESSINPDTHELPPTHLGWNGRLDGPVDNPRSSCMSCHMTAEVPTLSPLSPLFQANPPPIGSPDWMRWFGNEKCAVPFDAAAQSTDYSLQVAIGIENFELWAAPAQSGLFARDYLPPAPQADNSTLRLMAAPARPLARPRTYPIVRDIIETHDQ